MGKNCNVSGFCFTKWKRSFKILIFLGHSFKLQNELREPRRVLWFLFFTTKSTIIFLFHCTLTSQHFFFPNSFQLPFQHLFSLVYEFFLSWEFLPAFSLPKFFSIRFCFLLTAHEKLNIKWSEPAGWILSKERFDEGEF